MADHDLWQIVEEGTQHANGVRWWGSGKRLVPYANRRRILDREAKLGNTTHEDGFLYIRREICDPKHPLRHEDGFAGPGKFTHVQRMKWIDARFATSTERSGA